MCQNNCARKSKRKEHYEEDNGKLDDRFDFVLFI